jgi:hypothetical protein
LRRWRTLDSDVIIDEPSIKNREVIGGSAAAAHAGRSRQGVAVIRRVQVDAETDLPQIVDASRALRRCFGPGQCRQQQRRENADDGNHHEQFDQGESRVFMATSFHSR